MKSIDQKNTNREKIISLLSEEVYGHIPPRPVHLSYESEYIDPTFAAGKAVLKQITITTELSNAVASFPITEVMPTTDGAHPVIIYLGYESGIPNKFLPAEEIIDRGYGIINLCYSDIANGDSDYKSGISKKLSPTRRTKNAPSKTAIWAWALMRVMDYAEKNVEIDHSKIAVSSIGYLAKAVLLAGGVDERFTHIITNDALSLGLPVGGKSTAERVFTSIDRFPHLFAPRVQESADISLLEKEHSLLLKLCQDRFLLVLSAEDDIRSCFKEEKEMVNLLNEGLNLAKEKEIAFHSRKGAHYFSREDWSMALDFIDKSR